MFGSKTYFKSWLLYFSLCVCFALFFGFSFGDSSSNQPTYLPPGIKLARPDFLLNDWWLNSATHYHQMFNIVVALLAKANILPWGTVLINVLLVTLSLFFIFRYFYHNWQSSAIVGLFIFCSLYCLTNSFNSVASTYLYTSGLQASSFATCATVLALFYFLESRYTPSGLCLVVAGIFHINFLLVNLVAFSLALLFLEAKSIFSTLRITVRQFRLFAQLLAPSVIYLIISLPFIFSVSQTNDNQDLVQLAQYIFFHVAVPHHYLPNTYLIDFIPLLGWQLLGIAFLYLMPKHNSQRKRLSALQSACFITVWLATVLTTLVFITPVARLFFWRLAPFCVLLVCLSVYLGTKELFCGDFKASKRKLGVVMCGAALGALLIIRGQIYYYAVGDLRVLLFALILAGIVGMVFYVWLAPPQPSPTSLPRALPNALLVTAAAVFLGSFYATFNAEKYSLLFLTKTQQQKRQLYGFFKQHTSNTANVLIPPDLSGFRLFSQRSVVVDFKALPFGQENLLEWYRRLSDISGTAEPASFREITQGYKTLNEQRLDYLQQRYNITHVVVRSETLIELAQVGLDVELGQAPLGGEDVKLRQAQLGGERLSQAEVDLARVRKFPSWQWVFENEGFVVLSRKFH